MTAAELLTWALKNIHTSEWKLPMSMKANEEWVEEISDGQFDAIKKFVSICESTFKYYSGSRPCIDLDDIRACLKQMEEMRKNV